MKKATIYSTKTCAHCATAKNLLKQAGYEVDYKVLGEDVTKEEFEAACPGARVVPQTVIADQVFDGINPLKEFLAKHD